MLSRSGTAARVFSFLVLMFSTGCATQTLYDWGNYERSLSAQFVDHDPESVRQNLEETLAGLRQHDPRRIPPGLYADYGFLMFQRGDLGHAIESFRREAELFPESRALMDKLIAKVQERQGKNAARTTQTSR